MKGGTVTFSPRQYPNNGDCTPMQHAMLQAAVHTACDQPRACKANMAWLTLHEYASRNAACAAARVAINRQCFKGGDKTHREEVDNAYKGKRRCEGFIRNFAR